MNDYSATERDKQRVLTLLSQLADGQALDDGVLAGLQAMGLVTLAPDQTPRLTDEGRHYLLLRPFAPSPGTPVHRRR